MNCLLCQGIVSSDLTLSKIFSFQRLNPVPVCDTCLKQFVALSTVKTCCECGRKLTANSIDPCQDCVKWHQQFSHLFVNQALFEYNAAMKEYMRQYKFLGDYRLRAVFNQLMVSKLKSFRSSIVVIPVHPSTIQQRGFNQVRGLCEGVQLLNCLKTRYETKKQRQSEKGRFQRLKTEQPFELIPGKASLITNQSVVIVDDVYTTGTTIRHAASLLYRAGASSVSGLTLAR